MKELQEMVFIDEIVLQAKIAQRASERLQASADSTDVWSSIQSILIAAGNVSKVLWPSHKYEERGKRLRKLLNVEDNNLLSDRKFRNHFEHYDERIEEWFNSQSSAVYTDLAMNPSMYTFGGMPSNSHRGYNSFSNTLIFRGESLDLGAILDSLQEIKFSCRYYVLI
jgi:hypothetical protein